MQGKANKYTQVKEIKHANKPTKKQKIIEKKTLDRWYNPLYSINVIISERFL